MSVPSVNVMSFDSLPRPLDLLDRGGLPGVEYLYLLSEEQADAQDEGWSPIVGMRAFKVVGRSATLMAKGKPIPGAQSGGSRCRFYVSKALKEAITPKVAPTSPSTPKKESVTKTDYTPANENPLLKQK
jgi:hypothetical protein